MAFVLAMLKQLFAKEILNGAQLKEITDYEYCSEGITFLDSYFQVIWRWLEKQIPLTWAPNSLTITGLILNATTALILIYFCPTFTEEAPRWAYYLCALDVFLYQALDALDGKQCRRTNNDTALEEICDHSCDAVSTALLTLVFSISLQLGNLPGWLFIFFFSTLVTGYTTHWQKYVSGYFHFESFDVTEVQLTMMIFFLITGTFGPQIWSFEVFGTSLKIIFLELALILGIIKICAIISQITNGKNQLTVAETNVITPLFNIFSLVLLASNIILKTESELIGKYPHLYYLMFGMVYAKIVTKLVIESITKSPIEYVDSIWLAPLLVYINHYFNDLIPEYLILWLSLMYSIINYFQYTTRLLVQMSDYMGKFVFSITKKKTFKTATTLNNN